MKRSQFAIELRSIRHWSNRCFLLTMGSTHCRLNENVMSFYVGFISFPRRCHVISMLFLYRFQAHGLLYFFPFSFISFSCHLHVISMSFPRLLHVIFRSRSFHFPVLSLLSSCRFHVIFMSFSGHGHLIFHFSSHLHVVSMLFPCHFHAVFISASSYFHVRFCISVVAPKEAEVRF